MVVGFAIKVEVTSYAMKILRIEKVALLLTYKGGISVLLRIGKLKPEIKMGTGSGGNTVDQ